MSIIAFPRSTRRPLDTTRPSTRPSTRTTTRPTTHRPSSREPASLREGTDDRRRHAKSGHWWSRLTLSGRLAIVACVALVSVLVGTTFMAQRQIELHALQSQLLQAQSNYAREVASYTNVAAPSRVAAEAGTLHLVVPTTVLQISPVSLDTPLALPHFSAPVTVTSRMTALARTTP